MSSWLRSSTSSNPCFRWIQPRCGCAIRTTSRWRPHAARDSALFKEMVKSGQPISVGDVRDDPRFPAVDAPRLSWLGIPMIAKGELIGLIALEKWQAYFYSNEQIQLGTTFASQAAIALDNANLYEDSVSRAAELDERSKRLALLNRFSSSLSGLLDANEILDLTAGD